MKPATIRTFITINIIISVVCSFILSYTLLSPHLNKWFSPTDLTPSGEKQLLNGKPIRVALVSFSHAKSIDAVCERYHKTLDKSPYKYETKFYTANLNKMLMRSMCEEVLAHDDYDIIFTLGIFATQTIKELMAKRQKKIPHIFMGLLSQIWDEWIQDEPALKQNMTGCMGTYNWTKRINLMEYVVPNVKRILIPYSGGDAKMQEGIQVLEQELLSRGYEAQRLHLNNTSEVQTKIKPFAENTDLIFVTRDATLYDAMPFLANLAKRYGITLYTSDTDTIKDGGGFCLGVEESKPGEWGAEWTRQIIEQGIPVKDIPLTDVEENGSIVLFNKGVLEEQNIHINPILLSVLENKYVI